MYYGEGSVWVNRQTDSAGSRYLVETINLPGYDGSRYLGPHPHVQFVCETSKHRVIVDSVPDAGLRYRAWNNPNSLTGKPDFEIAKGTVQSEGTGPCRHSIWTFATGPTGYSVQELGCYTDAPAGAKGRLEVSTSGTTQASWWCF
jgi:hypothetical protein